MISTMTSDNNSKKSATIAEISPKATSYESHKLQLVWRNIIIFLLYHYLAAYGAYYLLTGHVSAKLFFFNYFFAIAATEGVCAGSHRLWAHRSYKAKLPLRIVLCIFQTMSFQNDIYEWSRDHRVHHKFSDTDADPHNATRGFFFSHMGWLLCRKHKDVITKGKIVDLSDLEADPVVMFQKKYYLILAPLLALVLPIWIPVYFWNEDLHVSSCGCMLRYMLCLHFAWLVNSAAHVWGYRPFDKTIRAAENIAVAYITFGEGWHNYHHTFPWDYKAAEMGAYNGNLTRRLIELWAKAGWAYELKSVPLAVVQRRIKKNERGI